MGRPKMADTVKDSPNGEGSPPMKRTRGSKAKIIPAHDISSENSEVEDDTQAGQMKQFADILSVAMGSALASMTQTLASQNAQQFPPKSPQDGGDEDKNSDSEDDNKQLPEDEVDEYDKSIGDLLGNQEKVGPDISDKIGRVLERCIDPILDDKAAREKRESFLRPGNVVNLKVPRLNNMIYKRISSETLGG